MLNFFDKMKDLKSERIILFAAIVTRFDAFYSADVWAATFIVFCSIQPVGSRRIKRCQLLEFRASLKVLLELVCTAFFDGKISINNVFCYYPLI